MALWTPYAEALDLSRAAGAGQQEPPAPVDLTDRSGRRDTSAKECGRHSPQGSWPCGYQSSLPPLSPPLSPEFYDLESLTEDKEYQEFERDALRAMAERSGGRLLGNNPRMRRAVQPAAADDSYKKQRERNNFAAKQSRDRRKLREVRLAFQVTFLKKKLVALRSQLAGGCCARCEAAH